MRRKGRGDCVAAGNAKANQPRGIRTYADRSATRLHERTEHTSRLAPPPSVLPPLPGAVPAAAPGTIPVNSFYGPIHAAVTWSAGMVAGVDIDISALAFDAAGNQLDACFFKKPEACNGAIGNMGDNTTGFGTYVDFNWASA
eukprot:gene2847-29541_t